MDPWFRIGRGVWFGLQWGSGEWGMRGSFTLEGEASHGPGAPLLLPWTLAAVSEPPPWFHGDPGDLSTKHSVGA